MIELFCPKGHKMIIDPMITNGSRNAVCFECRHMEEIHYSTDGTINRYVVIPPAGFWGEEVKPMDFPPFDIPHAPQPSEFYEVMKKFTAELEQQLWRGLMVPAAEFEQTSTASQTVTHQALDAADAIKKLIRQWEWEAAFRKQLASPESVQVHGSNFAPKDKVIIAPDWDGKYFVVCHKDDFAEVKRTVEEAHKRLTSEAT